MKSSTAKDQRLSTLNPAQISGTCGRLMCCLRHEHEFYVQQRKRFPKEGKIITTTAGEEKIVSNDIFRDLVTLRTAEGEYRTIPLADLRKETAPGIVPPETAAASGSLVALKRAPNEHARDHAHDHEDDSHQHEHDDEHVEEEHHSTMHQVHHPEPHDDTGIDEDTSGPSGEPHSGPSGEPRSGPSAAPTGPESAADAEHRKRRRRGRRGGRRGRGDTGGNGGNGGAAGSGGDAPPSKS